MRSDTNVDVTAVEPRQLADPQSRLDGQNQQSVVASAEPGLLVGSGKERVDLVGVEITDLNPVAELARDGEDTLDRGGVLGVPQGGVAEQRVDGSQAGVAGAGGVAAVVLKMGEERTDKLAVHVSHVEPARGLPR